MLEFQKKTKTFRNIGTKHKNKYMKDLNSKIKLLKVTNPFNYQTKERSRNSK